MLRGLSSFGLRVALPLLVAIPIAVACGEEVVIPPPSEEPDSGPGATDSGTDGTSNADGGADVADVVCPTVTPDDSAVFVAPSGTLATTCGTKAEPCRTITQAITRASAVAKNKIYVARGLYVERVLVKAGMRIEGGWEILPGGAWNRACVDTAQAVVIRSPNDQTSTILAKDLGGKSELALLRIESKPQGQVKEGESLSGIIATGATTVVALEEVTIDIANAGAGKEGAAGAAGAEPGAAGTCAAGTGANGARGQAGTGAPAGTFDQDGYDPKDGALGGASTAGAGGTKGTEGTCVKCGSCTPFPTCAFVALGPETCGTDGKNGCGGGGGPGAPGTGGGSSVGLFVWDANVTLTGGRIKAGDGGNGGTGGSGGAAKNGSMGVAGTPTAQCIVDCAVGNNACMEIKGRGEGGDAGGQGGQGGPGALGGGGSGGSSYAIYQGGAGLVTAATTTLSFGKAGKGADAGPGANGVAAARFP